MEMLRNISDFMPPGAQLTDPGGLSFLLSEVAAVELNDETVMTITFKGGRSCRCVFYHSNRDRAPAYATGDAIREAHTQLTKGSDMDSIS